MSPGLGSKCVTAPTVAAITLLGGATSIFNISSVGERFNWKTVFLSARKQFYSRIVPTIPWYLNRKGGETPLPQSNLLIEGQRWGRIWGVARDWEGVNTGIDICAQKV